MGVYAVEFDYETGKVIFHRIRHSREYNMSDESRVRVVDVLYKLTSSSDWGTRKKHNGFVVVRNPRTVGTRRAE